MSKRKFSTKRGWKLCKRALEPTCVVRNAALYLGDCREILPKLPPLFTSCVTDPPYELGFMGKGWDKQGVSFDPKTWAVVKEVLKPGANLLSFGGDRTWHRIFCAIEDAGFQLKHSAVRFWLHGQGFPKGVSIGTSIHKIRDDESSARDTAIRAPTPDSELWEGWNSSIKLAYEPIMSAVNPTKLTYAQNALEHGVSGYNIDVCRIGAEGVCSKADDTLGERSQWGSMSTDDFSPPVDGLGRWPANVLLDEGAAGLLDREFGDKTHSSGYKTAGLNTPVNSGSHFGSGKSRVRDIHRFGDNGGPSRFFYTGKSSSVERDGSQHPTIKPIDLMRWLLNLCSTPYGLLVIDPFMGSGSTMIAANQLGFHSVGIESDPANFEDAVERIKYASKAPVRQTRSPSERRERVPRINLGLKMD